MVPESQPIHAKPGALEAWCKTLFRVFAPLMVIGCVLAFSPILVGILLSVLNGGAPHVGSFLLEVRLDPVGRRQVVRVWTSPLPPPTERSEAEKIQAALRGSGGVAPSFTLEPVEGFDGGPFVVQVPCCIVTSGFGFDFEEDTVQVLVIKVEYADGQSELVVTKIPEGRGNRGVSVPLP
jgi:hypothetical protein